MSREQRPGGFEQSGDHATANIGTYNDVGRDQYNYTYNGMVAHPVFLDSWPRSRKAAYNADLKGAVTVIREPCTEGTRVDILERIYRWAADASADSPSVFWLTGEAGSGKSTIAYTVARHFDRDEGGNILGGNFFSSRQFEETRRQRHIIPTIVYQLARKSKPYADAVLRADKFDSIDDTYKQMDDLLVGPWQQSAGERPPQQPPYLVVVDALDEIENGEGLDFLQELLKTIKDGDLQGLKFFVTSRPDPQLAEVYSSLESNAVCRLYDVPTDTVEADIRKYLAAKLPKLQSSPELAGLARKADGLFIFAATAVRYATPRAKMTEAEQLRRIRKLIETASPVSGSVDTPLLIDTLYQQILWDAFRGLDEDELLDRLNVLHTLLCTEERVSTLVAGKLLSDSDDMEEMGNIVVDELHAVLYVKDGHVLWYHASFPDFMFAQARSKFKVPDASGTGTRVVDMSCDEAARHTLLTYACFRIMDSSLRFNICDLPSSFLLDSEVPDFGRRVEDNIGELIRYSCRYWSQHLTRTKAHDHEALRTRIREFLRIQVIFWLEAMNLLGLRPQCTTTLQRARDWVLKDDDGKPSDLARDVGEAANFATYFTASLAARSTPHLYISSLATWNRNSTLSQLWKKQFPRVPFFKQSQGRDTASLMTIQTENPVPSVALSSDGTRIVTGSLDNSARVWDALTGSLLLTLSGHTDFVSSVAFFSDGTRIVSGSADGSIRVWDASTGAELMMVNGLVNVISLALSSDSTRIASCSVDEHIVRVWDSSTGRTLVTLKGHASQVTSAAFSGDGTRVVSGSADGCVRVWDASKGVELMVLNDCGSVVLSVAFSRDGTLIASGAESGAVLMWDASTGAVLNSPKGHTKAVYSVGFSSDSTRLVSGSADKAVSVWNTSKGSQLMALNDHTDGVYSVAFSIDDTRIISGSTDGSARVWDASLCMEFSIPHGHMDTVSSVVFSGDCTHIISGSFDESVRVWDASTGEELGLTFDHTSRVNSVAPSNDGTRIVSGSSDQFLRLWESSTGRELMKLDGHASGVNSVAFSSDDTRIVSGSADCSVRVWDASTGAALMKLDGHMSDVNSVAFSRDGTCIVSGSNDRTVQVWDTLTGTRRMALYGHRDHVNSVGFSGDGTRIISSSLDQSVRVWDTSTGAQLMVLKGHTHNVFSAAFSSDSSQIVSGSADMSVRVWDALTGAELTVLSGHTSSVRSVGFSNDGTRIISGSSDNSVRVWDTLKASRGRALTGIGSSSVDGPFRSSDIVLHDHDWVLSPENWISRLPDHKRLMWVTPAIKEVLRYPHNCLLISRKGSAIVDFVNSSVGTEWARCYAK